jgi:signal transduction histidine kinase
MFESLRARLLAWYTTLLAVVIVGLGATMCYLTWQSRLADIDRNLLVRAESLAGALRPAADGTFDLTLPEPSATPDLTAAPYHVLWTPAGGVIDRSDPDVAVPLPGEPGARTRAGRREIAIRAASGATVLAGQSLDALRAEIWSLAGMVAALGLVALAISFAGGSWLVGRALRPIDRIGHTARTMIGGDFTARIPVDRIETELEEVAGALNDAFDRLHGSLERQRRFTSDASHELRTPLATLSTEAQWALNRERSPQEYRHALESCLRAAGRMQTVVERLLALARAEAGADNEARVPVQLDEIVRQAARDLLPLADARQIGIEVTVTPVTVSGVPDRLLDAITNVLVNAITYNIDRGQVRVTLVERDRHAELTVTDTGIGIAAADLPRVFDPFFRADPTDRRGAGLGLAVTRAVIESHGGTVGCESTFGRETTIAIRLPL